MRRIWVRTIQKCVSVGLICGFLALCAAGLFMGWHGLKAQGLDASTVNIVLFIAIFAMVVSLASVYAYRRTKEEAALQEKKRAWSTLEREKEELGQAKREHAKQAHLADQQMRTRETRVQTRENQVEQEVEQKVREGMREAQEQLREAQDQLREDKTLVREKTKGFPWLAKAYAELEYLRHMRVAEHLETKPHPAVVSADRVRAIGKERRTVETKYRITRGIIKYWMSLFPFLGELLGDTDEDLLRRVLDQNIAAPIKDETGMDVDPVRLYIPQEDYERLSTVERNQWALDKWRARPKSKWEIGRDYERYIGYLYEKDGYVVQYQGILEGYQDLGRDLVAKNEYETLVIQCKRWSKHKRIHEKHVNQLFGTVTKYKIDHRWENAQPVLYVTNELSDMAREFAKHLDVTVNEKFPHDDNYPMIKCNISRKNGEKIYHLPFDQQYDNTIIEPNHGECYVSSVEEAEALGFRRAWRWHGSEEE